MQGVQRRELRPRALRDLFLQQLEGRQCRAHAMPHQADRNRDHGCHEQDGDAEYASRQLVTLARRFADFDQNGNILWIDQIAHIGDTHAPAAGFDVAIRGLAVRGKVSGDLAEVASGGEQLHVAQVGNAKKHQFAFVGEQPFQGCVRQCHLDAVLLHAYLLGHGQDIVSQRLIVRKIGVTRSQPISGDGADHADAGKYQRQAPGEATAQGRELAGHFSRLRPPGSGDSRCHAQCEFRCRRRPACGAGGRYRLPPYCRLRRRRLRPTGSPKCFWQ